MIETERLAFAADRYNTYPSEPVQFYLRPAFGDIPPGYSVQVELPPALRVEDFQLSNRDHGQQVWAGERAGATLLHWQWDWMAPSLCSELVVRARVLPETPQGALLCRAWLVDGQGNLAEPCGVQVQVKRTAEMLRYLPEIYTRDDFTNRFLMLLESFWKPISQQIDQMDCYFDPGLTPAGFLPWLGAWFGLELDENLSEAAQRRMLANIAPIFALKGTQQALESFLAQYTGGKVSVTEQRDHNLVLGAGARLGYQVALGTDNHPHTFHVVVCLPAQHALHGGEESLLRQQYYRRIQALIDLFRPAHTIYHLEIQPA
ncbi:MAG: phage tail protein [Anaerolineaceae bacterium]|nr:phage tail protein [Anaerolineaceae bacterium]